MVKATLQVSLFAFISGRVLHLSPGQRRAPAFCILKCFPGKLCAPKSKQKAAEGL